VSQLQQQHALVGRPPLIDNRTICCRSCCPAARPSECQSLQHGTLTEKFPEDDTASANTTAWRVAVSERACLIKYYR